MIREIQDGIVDTSIAGFNWIPERSEIVDFTQGIFPNVNKIFIRRPTKQDISLKYFMLGNFPKRNQLFYTKVPTFQILNFTYLFLEFTIHAWIIIIAFYILLIFVFFLAIHALISFQKDKITNETRIGFALKTALDICGHAYLNKPNRRRKFLKTNRTYQILVMVVATLGFVILSYYKAQMNAALNVEVENVPISSWEDLDKSDYKILVWHGGVTESIFKNSPEGSLLQKIYQEKISTVPTKQHINFVGFNGTVSPILSDKFIAFESEESYQMLAEFPCKITKVDSIKYVNSSIITRYIKLPI